MNKLTEVQQEVLNEAKKPHGVHYRSAFMTIGRGNGRLRAAHKLVKLGLCAWDVKNPSILRAIDVPNDN